MVRGRTVGGPALLWDMPWVRAGPLRARVGLGSGFGMGPGGEPG